MGPGEKARRKRNQERKRAADAMKVAELRAAGKSCGNCLSFDFAHSLGKHVCQLYSDFDGYQIATADDLCSKHQPSNG